MKVLETCINLERVLATETEPQNSNDCRIIEVYLSLSCNSLHKHMGLVGPLHNHLTPRLISLSVLPSSIHGFYVMAQYSCSSSCHHICIPTISILPMCQPGAKEKEHELPTRT